jgi:hypothetical protein
VPPPLSRSRRRALASPRPRAPAAEIEAAASYANAEKAPATRRAYGTNLAIFRAGLVR